MNDKQTGATVDLVDLRQTPAVLDALYRYADPGSYCALRVFPHERGQPPPWAADVKAGDLSALIEAIARGARYAATSTTPTVFCPATGCTFRYPGTAKTRDIAEGLALAVELDDGDTAAVLARLEALIGVAHPGGAQRQPLGRPGNRRTAPEAARLLAIERGGEGRGGSDAALRRASQRRLADRGRPDRGRPGALLSLAGQPQPQESGTPRTMHRRPHQPRRRNPPDRRRRTAGRGD